MRYTLSSLFVFLTAVLISCGNTEVPTENIPAKGGKQYGGEFTFMSHEKINVLFPSYVGDIYNSRIISQIYEPLMVFDAKTKSIIPGVAESFTKSDDSKVYTFKIRKGVKFHKDDCFGGKTPELTAKDVKFTLDMACSGLEKNQIGHMFKRKIVGAEDFYNQTKGKKSIPAAGVSGIKVIDNNTIEITLINPSLGFESILTNPSLGVVSKKAFDHYGSKIESHPVGTGPFMLESKNSDQIKLKRNPNYWRKDEFGNQLPFLSSVVVTYAKNKKSELTAFGKGEIDLVLEIPVEEIENILGSLKEAQAGKNIKHKVDGEASLSMTYVAMACENETFKDVRVRRAFNLALNRKAIIDNWLEGEGWAAENGFVPNMKNYDNSMVSGPAYNPDAAKSLLASAGYPNGSNFPTFDFYVNAKEGSGDHKMSQAISQQLKENLNVNLNIKLCSFEEREAAIANGNASIWKSGWVADYPDPENFLSLFYGGNVDGSYSQMSPFNFRSDQFDRLFESANETVNPEERSKILSKCDQVVVDEAPVLPILTGDHIVMINARVRNFKASPLESLNLTSVYIKKALNTED